jgi:hypothetical protein
MNSLTGGSLILDLPGEPGPNHDGGKIKIGPDGWYCIKYNSIRMWIYAKHPFLQVTSAT